MAGRRKPQPWRRWGWGESGQGPGRPRMMKLGTGGLGTGGPGRAHGRGGILRKGAHPPRPHRRQGSPQASLQPCRVKTRPCHPTRPCVAPSLPSAPPSAPATRALAVPPARQRHPVSWPLHERCLCLACQSQDSLRVCSSVSPQTWLEHHPSEASSSHPAPNGPLLTAWHTAPPDTWLLSSPQQGAQACSVTCSDSGKALRAAREGQCERGGSGTQVCQSSTGGLHPWVGPLPRGQLLGTPGQVQAHRDTATRVREDGPGTGSCDPTSRKQPRARAHGHLPHLLEQPILWPPAVQASDHGDHRPL